MPAPPALPRRRLEPPDGPRAAARAHGAVARPRPLKRWRYVGVYGAGADAVRRRASASAGVPQALLGGVGPRRAACCASARVCAGAARGAARGGVRVRDRDVPIDAARSSRPASRSRSSPPRRALHLDAQAAGARARDGRRSTAAARGRRGRPRRRLRRLPRARTRAGAGAPASARRPTAARSPGTSSTACTTRRPTASARCGSTARAPRSPPARFAPTSAP